MAEMNANAAVTIRPVTDKAGLNAFIDVGYRLTRDDPNQVLPLRMDMVEMFNPAKNPFFGHARVQPMVAYRGGRVVGRISAHIDELALTTTQMRLRRDFPGIELAPVLGDCGDPAVIGYALDLVKPDAVFHAGMIGGAGVGHP